MTRGRRVGLISDGRPAKAFNAEASITKGSSIEATVARTHVYARSVSGNPGPISAADFFCRNSAMSPPDQVIDSIEAAWISFAVSGSVITVTRPAPVRIAPRAHITAAPLLPAEPATMPTWPYVP